MPWAPRGPSEARRGWRGRMGVMLGGLRGELRLRAVRARQAAHPGARHSGTLGRSYLLGLFETTYSWEGSLLGYINSFEHPIFCVGTHLDSI